MVGEKRGDKLETSTVMTMMKVAGDGVYASAKKKNEKHLHEMSTMAQIQWSQQEITNMATHNRIPKGIGVTMRTIILIIIQRAENIKMVTIIFCFVTDAVFSIGMEPI